MASLCVCHLGGKAATNAALSKPERFKIINSSAARILEKACSSLKHRDAGRLARVKTQTVVQRRASSARFFGHPENEAGPSERADGLLISCPLRTCPFS